jgi:hypothetical protein
VRIDTFFCDGCLAQKEVKRDEYSRETPKPIRRHPEPQQAPAGDQHSALSGDADVLRAVASTDGLTKNIGTASGLGANVAYRLKKLKAAGLVTSEGQSRWTKYSLTTQGQKAIGGGNGRATHATSSTSSGSTWTLEQRRLLKFLNERGGSASIGLVRDSLSWSESLFDRASDRPEFKVVGDVVSVAK